MIFLKHFDIANQKLAGVGKVYVPRASKVADLILVINDRMRRPASTPLKLYEVSNYACMRHGCWLTFPCLGNQTWHDRAHEAQTDVHAERNPGW